MFDAPPVKAGTTVTVVNTDAVSHTLTVKGQGIDVKLGAGETGSFTAPTTPGDYPLSCDVHPSMQGTLTVT